MSLNFNVSPYYDDFDPAKNYHRVLFKPGFAVQARELTQSQSILQNQITNFADNIFVSNSPVTGGQVTTNLNCYYIKLQPTYNNAMIDVTQFNGLLIQDSTGTVSAKVIAVTQATSTTAGVGDPPTLIVVYKSGAQFTDGSVIYSSTTSLGAQAQLLNATGRSSVASIAQGVFYISSNYVNATGETISSGVFVQVNPQTVVLDKYDNNPNLRVGLNITETIVDYINDASLLDPAIGASNYQAPGADRYQITLNLETRPLQLGDDNGFIELIRITNGNISKTVDGSVYSVIDDYFAKRDYETNGDYVVNDFKLTPKTNTNDSSNNTYVMSIGKGLAYVKGHRVESTSSVDLVTDRARTTASLTNNPVYLSYGNYFYVDTVRGANNTFFDTTTQQGVDLHCVPLSSVNVSSYLAYSSTLVASANVRSLFYDHNTNDAAANTYVYKLFVNSLQSQTSNANVVSATSNTITLPSYYTSQNNAYVGVSVSILSGTDAGDFKTITAYNGVTKVATVNQNWTVTPDTTSVFSLNFATTQANSIIGVTKSSWPATINATANINAATGKDVYGNTILENPVSPELLFQVGNPYVSSLTNTSYTSQQEWRNVTFNATGSGVAAILSYSGYNNTLRHFGTPSSTLNSSLVKQNFTIVVTNKGTNTNINVGDVLSFTTTGRTISLDSTGLIATLAATDIASQFSATILETIFVENGDSTGYILKNKNLITANTSVVNLSGTQVNSYTFVDNTTYVSPSSKSTGQVYIQHAGLVTPGTKQSLYLSDVKGIVQIIDTGNPNVVPTVSMLGANSPYDVTSHYILDNGQRDSYYDHAGITLVPGAPQPVGNLLVLVNYYQHTGGDGYFSIQSYLNSSSPEQYQSIPQYTSKGGTLYSLRDCIDFRPARLNAQSSFVFRYSNAASNYGLLIPTDSSIFEGNYSYYLGRKDYLVLTKDRNFKIIEGAPSINPSLPAVPDGSMILAQLSLKPYTGYIPTEAPTGYVPDLSVNTVPHKRYTMQDIGALETRINNMEYYTSLSVLEQNAQSLQISDAYGLNRFKNGIMVDDFSSYATADTVNPDYGVSINRRSKIMTALQNVNNYPLKSLALAYNMGLPSSATSSALGYNISTDGLVNYFSLPFTTANAIVQQFASRTVNVNPFAFVTEQGTMSLTPNVDNWVDNTQSPALLITDPNLQVFQANSSAINVLSAGDWQTISGTSYSSSQSVINHGNPNVHSPYGSVVGYTSTTTYSSQTNQQTNILGNYDKIGNTYSLNNGYITDISVLPYIQAQEIIISAQGLLFNSNLEASFDGQNIQNYVRKTNIIELTNVSGTFNVNDIIGYSSSGVFKGTARIIGLQKYPGTTNVRLYVASDPYTTSYSATGTVGETIQNAFFDQNGNYQSTSVTATGQFASQTNYGGRLVSSSGSSVSLGALASSTTNFYNGMTLHICTGTGIGQSAVITSYNPSTKVATLSTTVNASAGDVYSIGSLNTDEYGSFYGIFNIPAGVFHTGQRVLQVDNGVNFNANSYTTYAQATFYAEGLQTTSQSVDFGASPAGAKNTFTQTNQQTSTNIVTTYSPYDPVAQTFEVSVDNYPNGLFLNSIKVFFASKPTDNSPVHLSIVGTLNGYPNGSTLDHSIVTLTPDQVNVSQNPQFLDSTAYTEFQFDVPVYIQSGVLYAFMVKSNSDEYTLWTAAAGDIAVSSSVKNLPTDNTPSTITKIGSAPYVGALFLSQNSQTWTADQNQDLMFVADCCVFNTNVNPTIQFVVPNKLPKRSLVDQSVTYFNNANTVSNTTVISSINTLVDAFNITTTDFVPSSTGITYQYNATLASGGMTGFSSVTPGKYGTSIPDNIYLNDGQGERVLVANANASFIVTSQLSTTDKYVSPIISDAGLSTFAINWNINNCSLSNNLVNLISTGSGYSNSNTIVTISAPTGKNGVQATAVANVVNGNVTAIYITSGGQGYITTPTITITGSGTGSSANITGETSTSGGPALAKYVTKKVVLAVGNDSGDLNVYLTAYRPVNTDINVYYKILNRNDTQSFESGTWQLMTKTNSCDTLYSQYRTDVQEFSFAPGTSGTDQGYVSYTSTNGQTYNSFSQFAIKVVLTTTDKTAVPYVNSLQAIALPSNVNTTN
jgi:hypothetical protein